MDQEFRLRKIDKKKLTRKKPKEVCKILNYTENLLILTSTVTECVSIFAFASLIDIPVGVSSLKQQ